MELENIERLKGRSEFGCMYVEGVLPIYSFETWGSRVGLVGRYPQELAQRGIFNSLVFSCLSMDIIIAGLDPWWIAP